MKNTIGTLLAAFATITTLALLPATACAETANTAAKSMRGTEVSTNDAVAEPKAYSGKRPGTQSLVGRTFSTQPPVIPHAVENFDEITLEENQCLSCHGADVFKKKNAPMMGKSHFVDRDGKKLEAASSARHSCVMCHVAQVDAPALVENAFKGDVAPVKNKK